MLIEFSVQNYLSFNTAQKLSFVASSSTKESLNDENTVPINNFGIKRLLKSCVIFGSNNAGKSNLVQSLNAMKLLIVNSINTSSEDKQDNIIPFAIKENRFDIPTEFEVSFIKNETLYRYGVSLRNSIIEEEWLYRTKSNKTTTSRETKLFHRILQKIEINQTSFNEAKAFIKKDGESYKIEKTREDVTFITVLNSFNGEVSRDVIDWFMDLQSISGIGDENYSNYTLRLFEDDPDFKSWALEILTSVQIQDITIHETDQLFPVANSTAEDEDVMKVVASIQDLMAKKKVKQKTLEVIKHINSSSKVSLPLGLESDGTRKLLHILGPLYTTMKTGKILLIDEFDTKFHTLLSRFIIDLYHRCSDGRGQVLLTCHDTNLLNKETFRRDQIWFAEKNSKHETELFSLVEYKEHYTRKDDSYSKDYLAGSYGAVPLFSSIDHFKSCLEA